MKLLRIAAHGFVLCIANQMGIIIGFSAFHFLGSNNQIAVQAPIAAVITLIIFLMWTYFLRIFPFKILRLPSAREFSWVFIASLAWGPIAFIPIHLTTQGYLTGMGNIIALFTFQLPVNLLVLVVVRNIFR